MINTETFKTEHQTVADQTTWYSIGFVYDKDSATGAPELWVRLDGNDLTWGSDYTVGVQGLQLTSAPTAGLNLVISRGIKLTQEQDYQTGLISAEQIEHGFDRSVMRDQYLLECADEVWHYADDGFNSLAPVAWSGDYSDLTNTPLIGDATITLTQNGVIKGSFTTNQNGNATIALDVGMTSVDWTDITNKPTFATVATSGSYNDLLNTPALATVATTGSYNDLSNKPTIPTVGNGTITLTQGGVLKGTFTTNQSGNTTIDMDAGGGSALPDQTGNAGKFLTTDGTDASWADALTNKATGTHSLSIYTTFPTAGANTVQIGHESYVGGNSATVVGVDATAGYYGVAYGRQSGATANYAVAVGALTTASGVNSVQIGSTGSTTTNSDANTVKFANANGNFEMMSADGTIPESRLADTTGATQGDVLTLDAYGNAVWQAGGGAALPSQAGHNGEFLTTDGTDPSWAVATAVTFRVWGPNE